MFECRFISENIYLSILFSDFLSSGTYSTIYFDFEFV